VSVRPAAADATIGELGPLQARLDLLGGSLESCPQGLVARIPLLARPAVPLQHPHPSTARAVEAR
jgi:hypothetical protein